MTTRETYYGKIYANEWSEFENLTSALSAGSKYVIAEYLDLSSNNSNMNLRCIYDSSSKRTTTISHGKWKFTNIHLYHQYNDYSINCDLIDPMGVKESKHFKSRSDVTTAFDMMMSYLEDASGFLSRKEQQLSKENLKLKEENNHLKKENSELRKKLEEN